MNTSTSPSNSVHTLIFILRSLIILKTLLFSLMSQTSLGSELYSDTHGEPEEASASSPQIPNSFRPLAVSDSQNREVVSVSVPERDQLSTFSVTQAIKVCSSRARDFPV